MGLEEGSFTVLLQGLPSTGRQLSAALQQVIVASVQAEVIRRRMAVRHPLCAADYGSQCNAAPAATCSLDPVNLSAPCKQSLWRR